MVTLLTSKVMFPHQATINQSSTGQPKDIRKKTINFSEMKFNFTRECGARPCVVNHFVFSQAAVHTLFFCCSCNHLRCPSIRWLSLMMGPVQSWGSSHWGPQEMKLFMNAMLLTLQARSRPPPDSVCSEVSVKAPLHLQRKTLVVKMTLATIWSDIFS